MTSGSVVVSDDALLICDLLETDRDVVDFVAKSDDPVDATRRCLRVGVRAIRAASATIDSDTVSTRFDALHLGLTSCITEAVGQIAAAAGCLLDEENGALSNTLELHSKQLGDLLDHRFDPESKVSIMGKIEAIVAEALARQTEGIKRVISLDSNDGPLQVLKTEILAGFSGPVADLAGQLRDLSEKVAVNSAVAPLIEITTAKGFTFEAVLHERVSSIASPHGDMAEMTGGETGFAGTKKGDEVVTLNTEDTLGTERRFVLEAKARRLNARQTHDELDAALENRGALAAIAVLDDPSKTPSAVPFHYSGNKAIVVLDDDAAALRLAYMWARWVVRREGQQDDTDVLDHERITQLIASGKRSIERHSTIKRSHSQARNCIEQAASQVESMASEIESTLIDLEAELSGIRV